MNAGINYDLTFDEWEKNMVIIQDIFVLVRWKPNFMRSWSFWFRSKDFWDTPKHSIKGNEVEKNIPEFWKGVKGGRKR